MNKNYLLIGGLALVGTGAYFLYKKDKDSKDAEADKNKTAEEILAKQVEAQEKNAAKIIAEQKYQSSIDLQNKNSYAAKVARVQLYLGVTPTGKVGANTIKALVTMMSTKFDSINEGNVDAILTEIDARKKSASDLSQKTTTTSALQEKIAFAKKLETLTSDGSKYAELLNNVSAPAYAFDSLTGSYKYLGNKKSFSKGSQFKRNLVSRGNGEILIKDGSTRYAVDPNNFIVKSN